MRYIGLLCVVLVGHPALAEEATKPNVLIPENQELLILTPNLEFRKMKLEDLPEYMEEEE